MIRFLRFTAHRCPTAAELYGSAAEGVGVAAQDDTGSLPRELLGGVSWAFRGEPFADRAAFDVAVAEYQSPDRGEVWRPAEVCLPAARVRITPDVHWYLSDDDP